MTAHSSLKPQPLLRKAFPPNGLSARENELLAILDQVIESDIAPQAAAHDEKGRYPTNAVAALKRSGVIENGGSCGLWRAGIFIALLARSAGSLEHCRFRGGADFQDSR